MLSFFSQLAFTVTLCHSLLLNHRLTLTGATVYNSSKQKILKGWCSRYISTSSAEHDRVLWAAILYNKVYNKIAVAFNGSVI